MQQVIVQGGRQHGKNAARMEWVRRDAPDLYDLISQLAPEDQYQATLFAGEDQPVSLLFTKLNWRLTMRSIHSAAPETVPPPVIPSR